MLNRETETREFILLSVRSKYNQNTMRIISIDTNKVKWEMKGIECNSSFILFYCLVQKK
jgi:hypothetical protein